jgi:DNA-binding NarL/FixJ family response regulator
VKRAAFVTRGDDARICKRAMMCRPMEGSFVTILFTDLVGSTSLFERQGDDAADAVRREHFDALRQAVAEHGGREVKSTGDGLMVAFSSAVAAVRCAVDMQRTTAAMGQLELSVGLDAGEPLPEGDDLYGTPVIVASRLCDVAGAGEILASEVVCRIAGPRVAEPIHPAGALRLRGISGRVASSQVGWRGDASEVPAAPEPAAAPALIDVVVADDQRLVRAGFRVILEDEPDMRVVGEAADGRSAVDIVVRTRPDVVLMDIRMPELGGLKAAERILSEPELDTAVLMLTTFDLDEYIYEALRIGASGFLLKDAPADRLLEAVRVAAAGDALLAPSITRRLIAQFARSARPQLDAVPDTLAELTSRELEVLGLVARGLSNSEIAAELVLGENTIKTHVAHVLSKLGLRDRVQAVVLAYEAGLVTPELSPGPSTTAD